jgi:hypothetical protein
MAVTLLFLPCLNDAQGQSIDGSGDKVSPSEAFETIVAVFSANREKFKSFSCRFHVVRGTADSLEAAWKENFKILSVQEGLFAAKDGDLRYDLRCEMGEKSLEQMASEQDNNAHRSFTGANCLSSGEFLHARLNMRVAYGSTLRVLNIDGKGSFEGTLNPLAMGIMGRGDQFSPVAWIQGAKAGKYESKYKGTELIDGVVVDVVECGLERNSERQTRFVWFLDLARGAIPVRYCRYEPDGTMSAETKAFDVRKLDNGGYICGKTVSVYAGNQGRCDVWVITLDAIDFTEPPRDMFALDVDAGWSVVNVEDMRSSVRLSQNERFYLDELPQWIERCNGRLNVVVEQQRELGSSPETVAHPSGAWWWFAASIGLVVMFGVLIIRRYLHLGV